MARLPTLSNLDPTKFYIDPSGRSFDRVRERRESTPVDLNSRAKLSGDYEPVLAMIRGQQQALAESVGRRDAAIDSFTQQSNRADRIAAGNQVTLIPKIATGAGAVTGLARLGSAVLQGGTVQRYAESINPTLASGLDTIGNALGKVESLSNNVSNAIGKILGAGDRDPFAFRQDLSNQFYSNYLNNVPVTDRYDAYLKGIDTENQKYLDAVKAGEQAEGAELASILASGAEFDSTTGQYYLNGSPVGTPASNWRLTTNNYNTRENLDAFILPRLREDLLAAQKSSAEEQQQLAQQRISEQAAAAQQFAESKPAQQQSLGARLGATSLFSDDLHQQMLARNK